MVIARPRAVDDVRQAADFKSFSLAEWRDHGVQQRAEKGSGFRFPGSNTSREPVLLVRKRR